MTKGNLLIIQGGGPTAVFNASLSAAIAESSRHDVFGRIYGSRSGLLGLVRGNYADLDRLDSRELRLLRASPGAALGTSRYKPAEADFEQMLTHLRRCEIGYLLFIGGNGTMRGAEVVCAFCKDAGFDVRVICVPKTVDNDLTGTDRSPGYGSAARYIAQSTRDLGCDVRSLPQPVSILETMGRSVGWLAGAAALAKRDEHDAPHLVYVPERVFVLDTFLGDLERLLTQQAWAVVVVAEGLRDADGSLVYQTSNTAQFDALRRPLTGGVGEYLSGIVADRLRIRCRSEKPGILGRASMVHVSAQDMDEAELVGRAGVTALAEGHSGKMVALHPMAASGKAQCDLVELSTVAGRERTIPARYLSDGPLSVNQSFISYAAPLAGKLPEYFHGASIGLG